MYRSKKDAFIGLSVLIGGSAILWGLVYVLCSLVYHYPVLAVIAVAAVTVIALVMTEDRKLRGIDEAQEELDNE